ncbi:MAG: dihydrodipicolinate synthase family protein [Planctomycetota bacterium]|jgi:4-hydroxy-tetrahydrodipicolinate synthase
MTEKNLPRPFKGIIVPMITPLIDINTLDVDGLEKLIEHILAGGVNALFILGTTGEAPSLGYKLRFELIERTCKQVANRVPVFVGITDTSFIESMDVASKAADAGVQALVLAPPYYFSSSQPELLEYVEHLVSKLPLPVFLYNMPSHTKVVFEPETIRAVSDIDGIIGLKDSSCNMVYFHLVQMALKDRPDFTLLVGPEELLAEAVLLGAHGGVNGGANICPRLYVDLYNAAVRKDLSAILPLQDKVMQISTKIYNVGLYGGSRIIKGTKCTLSCLGICNDFMAEPFHRFRKPERDRVLRLINELGIRANC